MRALSISNILNYIDVVYPTVYSHFVDNIHHNKKASFIDERTYTIYKFWMKNF